MLAGSHVSDRCQSDRLFLLCPFKKSLKNGDEKALLHSLQSSSGIVNMRVRHILCRLKSLVPRKPVFGVSENVRHKPGRTAIEDGQRLEISSFELEK